MLLSTLHSACLIILINKQSLINNTGNTVTWVMECQTPGGSNAAQLLWEERREQGKGYWKAALDEPL